MEIKDTSQNQNPYGFKSCIPSRNNEERDNKLSDHRALFSLIRASRIDQCPILVVHGYSDMATAIRDHTYLLGLLLWSLFPAIVSIIDLNSDCTLSVSQRSYLSYISDHTSLSYTSAIIAFPDVTSDYIKRSYLYSLCLVDKAIVSRWIRSRSQLKYQDVGRKMSKKVIVATTGVGFLQKCFYHLPLWSNYPWWKFGDNRFRTDWLYNTQTNKQRLAQL